MGEYRPDNWSMKVIALYDYEPEQLDELGFEEGDVLQVLHVQDDGWWSGYNVKIPDIIGLFPSNYVQAQRTVPPKSLVDIGTTPRLPVSSRQRIQLQSQHAPNTREFDDEDEVDDKMQQLRGEYRGHVGAVLQLRKNLVEAERASEALRDARRQAERERLRHRKSWRGREQVEEGENRHLLQLVQANHQQQELPPKDGEDTEEEDGSAFPQQHGFMHGSDLQQAEATEANIIPTTDEKNKLQTLVGQTAKMTDAENAAATLIARRYRHRTAMVQNDHDREQEAEQQKKRSKIAAVCIQHAYSRQRKRRLHELEKKTVRQDIKREIGAAADIQRWIRLRWACFWRKRVQIEREERAAKDAQQRAEVLKVELKEKLRIAAENEEVVQRLANEEESYLKAEKEQEQRRVLQPKLENDEQYRRQLQLRAAEEEIQLQPVHVEVQGEQHDDDPAVPSQIPPSPFHKPRRKVMKREAVELIKTLVQQQLGDTLRDHDTKMDELQRMVVKLQTVVRKQTVMLQDSTDQLVNLQMRRQEQKLPMPPRNNDTGGCLFLPRINGQFQAPRHPVAPSRLRPPRPVMSTLPGAVRSAGYNESKKV